MSKPTEKTSTFSDAHLHAEIHLASSDDDPTNIGASNTPSQILLEALQNFVIPLIHATNEKNEKNIHLDAEAGKLKLLAALEEFISSMIIQSRATQPQGIMVDLKGPDNDVPSDDAVDKAADSTVFDSETSKDVIPGPKEKYQSFMGRLQGAVREHVFRKMPIRVLHFTDTPQDPGTQLQITLLDRNGVCDRVMEKIQATHPMLGESEDVEKLVQENTKYAILSHTWLRGSDSEVTYNAWQLRQFNTQQLGYQKLANFCKSAWIYHGLSFGWMDTVCINKDSSSELDESIRSMYKWYQSSNVCITYLAETLTLDNICRDPWFTRGWTFQELLAPDHMTFHCKDWRKFVPYTSPGDKHNPDILNQISKAMKITEEELRRPDKMHVSRKMQLAASRNVMREEDIAYSLMGICNVSISIAYGEGAKQAFFRLMTEILNSSPNIFGIFNCAQIGNLRSIIPSAPSAYLQCSKTIMEREHEYPPPIEPLLLTHIGLRMPILLMPALREEDPGLQNASIGDFHAMVPIPFNPILRSRSSNVDKTYHLLVKGKGTDDYLVMFGILNFGGDATRISVPDLCLAICFYWEPKKVLEFDPTSLDQKQVQTKKPIVFHLKNRRRSTPGDGSNIYLLTRSALARHGMILTTMYL